MTAGRIAALPRRSWEGSITRADIVSMTEVLRQPHGTQELRPVQAAALIEAAELGGVFAQIRVGGGKTLISALLPLVLGAERPMLIVPGALARQTKPRIEQIGRHWRIPVYLRIESYSKLSNENHVHMLEAYRPDLLILDEAHKVKAIDTAACARRIARYLHAHPETKVCAMSGTFGRYITDFAHIVDWCLRAHSPLPRTLTEQKTWSQILDQGDTEQLPEFSEQIGVKVTTINAARAAFGERFTQSPGVIVSVDSFSASRLELDRIWVQPPDMLAPHFERLRTLWEAPDGWPLADVKFEVWRVARQLGLGFFYYHDPRPPDHWFQARKRYLRFVRETIETSNFYDSEKQVRNALQANILHSDAFDEWAAVQNDFTPNAQVQWISDHVLNVCEKWGRKGGILWTEHSAFADMLAAITGWPYYGPQGVNAEGSHVELAREPTIICSVAANRTGVNLQHYHRNLITCPHPSAEWNEQLIGRTMRDGQKADVVKVDFLITTSESLTSIETAKRDAEAIEFNTTQQQLLRTGEWLESPKPRLKANPIWD